MSDDDDGKALLDRMRAAEDGGLIYLSWTQDEDGAIVEVHITDIFGLDWGVMGGSGPTIKEALEDGDAK